MSALAGLVLGLTGLLATGAAVALFSVAFWRDRAARLLSGFAWFYTAGLVGVYAFSAVPDLQWHVAALDRLLVIPACALALAVGRRCGPCG